MFSAEAVARVPAIVDRAIETVIRRALERDGLRFAMWHNAGSIWQRVMRSMHWVPRCDGPQSNLPSATDERVSE